MEKKAQQKPFQVFIQHFPRCLAIVSTSLGAEREGEKDCEQGNEHFEVRREAFCVSHTVGVFITQGVRKKVRVV